MDQDTIATNLAVVEAHFGSEAVGRVEEAIALYTDDVVWEAPSRHVLLKGKAAVADNYRQIFHTIQNIQWHCLDRFATEDRVVDDSLITFEVATEGFIPLPVGTRCEMRLTHIFEMRDGKISKEIGIEGPPRPL
jgi:ketosteroid isomerase-like protein